MAAPCRILSGLSVAMLILVGVQAETVLYGVGGDFKGFDPIDADDVESAHQVSRVYEGLLEYSYLDRPYKAISRLAEAMPKVSSDGLTYTFQIKKGVHFSDDPCFPNGKGRELVAEDFVYSFKRLLNPKLTSSGDWIFVNHVLGAREWEKMCSDAKEVDYSQQLAGFQVPDRYTLQIRLRQPYPQLLWALTMTYTFAVPREAVEFYKGDFRNYPVGTGPFRLKKWRRSYRIEFERNPTFSGQTFPVSDDPAFSQDAGKPLPLLDRIVDYDIREFYTMWQLFLGGQIFGSAINKDYFEKVITPQLDLSDALKKRGIRLYKTPELTLHYIGFNMADPVIGRSEDPTINERHRKLRQAFATAIDVDMFIKVIRNGRDIPANSVIPPGIAGHTDKPYAYKFDLARAKRLLAEAGYPGGKDAKGNPLRLTMIMPGAGSTDARQEADFYAEHLRAVGVNLVVQQLTFAEYLRREHDGQTQVFWAGWVIDYPDAQNFLQLFYGPNRCPGVNFTNYQNPEFDRLYEQILSLSDSPERTRLYEKMADLVHEDCVCALVGYPLTYGLYQPWFQNFKPHDFPYPNAKYYKVLPH